MRMFKKLLEAHGYEVHFIEGDDPLPMHQAFAATLDTCYANPGQSDRGAHEGLLQTADLAGHRCVAPKDGPGRRSSIACRWRARSGPIQVPLPNVRDNPAHLQMLEQWMRSYRPEDLFDKSGRLIGVGRSGPQGRPADGRQPPRQRRAPHRGP